MFDAYALLSVVIVCSGAVSLVSPFSGAKVSSFSSLSSSLGLISSLSSFSSETSSTISVGSSACSLVCVTFLETVFFAVFLPCFVTTVAVGMSCGCVGILLTSSSVVSLYSDVVWSAVSADASSSIISFSATSSWSSPSVA